jgi:hypothetical protein
VQSAFGPVPTYTDYENYQQQGTLTLPRQISGKSAASRFERTIPTRIFGQKLDPGLFSKPE